ncbi:MAG: ferrous iron transport protein A [Porcipelethomonas sp.]
MSHKIVTLDKLEAGERGVVLRLGSKGTLRRRLRDIGVIDGTVIECVGTSPFGDPKAYLIKGAVIAIRNIDSEKIEVDKFK